MKNLKQIFVFVFIAIANFAFACDACKLQQPKITKNITHGTGPDGNMDWLIVGIVGIITLITLYYSVKFLVKPGEKDKKHIKYSFLE